MTSKPHWAKALLGVVALALAGVAAADDNDKREISSYVMTEAGLARFKQATSNLSAVPGACARTDDLEDDDDDDSASQSLDQMVAKLDAVPGAKAAIQSAGMTTREYVVFMWSLMQTGMSAWAQDQGGKLPPGVSQANVDFYRKHEAEMKSIGDNDPCDDDSDDDDEEDDA
jgi:hypothetical protein